MKRFVLLLLLLSLLHPAISQEILQGSKISINNPSIHKVIAENARLEILGKGYGWAEGPLWLESENKLIFSDIPANSVYEWSEEGGIKLFLKPAGYTGDRERGGETGSNGLLLNNNNELILCQHGDRRIAKMNANYLIQNPNLKRLQPNIRGKK